jgi:flagellar hook protein FlgE
MFYWRNQMQSAFIIGLSGMRANSTSLNVVGNNLANLNTTGFKASVTSFQDLLGSTLAGVNGAGNPMQPGLGVGLSGISSVFTQGGLQTTGQATDVAILGNGFFVVNNGQQNFFTRAGDFTLNNQGYLTTQQGMYVQGYSITNGVGGSGSLGKLQLNPGASMAPKATGTVGLDLNLNANAAVGDKFNTSIDVYDSLGKAHTLTYTFEKTGANAWNYSVKVPGADVGKTDPVEVTKGTLAFNASGQLTTPSSDVANLKISGFANGAADLTFTWQVKNPSGAMRLTQFNTPSSTSQATQDGYTFGNLTGFQIDSSGYVQGTFSNGQLQLMGQIALANFNNPQGLVREGQNQFMASASSGEPIIGIPGTAGRGGLVGSALEFSNVDIAQEFTSMIIAQRGYQASSKIITTADEVLQEALALKR